MLKLGHYLGPSRDVGPVITTKILIENGQVLHQMSPYEDEKKEQTFPPLAEVLKPTPEVGSHYIGAQILLLRGDQMARGHVVARSRDAIGNVMGRSTQT